MAERNRRNPNERIQPDYEQGYNRQTEQFQPGRQQQFGEPPQQSYADQGPGQMGDAYGGDNYDRGYAGGGYGRQAAMPPNPTGRAPQDRYSRGEGFAGPGAYSGVNPGQSHSYFRGDEYGGGTPSSPSTREYGRHLDAYDGGSPRGYGAGGYGGAGHAADFTGGGAATRRYREEERGFFDRTGDEIASWFGDEEAERRREMDHRGRGPSNYTRSDERILEDACDRLTDDPGVDAREVTVTVEKGEITLDGTVPSRRQKRRAEDCVYDISGIGHVQNNLRIQQPDLSARENTDRTSGTLA